MKALKELFIFVIGAATGAAITYYYAKEKYEQINKEEQESLLEHYGIKRAEETDTKSKIQENLHKPDINEYKSVVEKTNYNSFTKSAVKDEVPKVSKMKKQRAIEMSSLDDAGNSGYEVITLELYSDGVIASEDDHEVIDSDAYFGDLDLDEIFEGSEYGDCVYIRNHELEYDIELCKNADSYSDTIASIYSED